MSSIGIIGKITDASGDTLPSKEFKCDKNSYITKIYGGVIDTTFIPNFIYNLGFSCNNEGYIGSHILPKNGAGFKNFDVSNKDGFTSISGTSTNMKLYYNDTEKFNIGSPFNTHFPGMQKEVEKTMKCNDGEKITGIKITHGGDPKSPIINSYEVFCDRISPISPIVNNNNTDNISTISYIDTSKFTNDNNITPWVIGVIVCIIITIIVYVIVFIRKRSKVNIELPSQTILNNEI